MKNQICSYSNWDCEANIHYGHLIDHFLFIDIGIKTKDKLFNDIYDRCLEILNDMREKDIIVCEDRILTLAASINIKVNTNEN
jgi:hypothetical protein